MYVFYIQKPLCAGCKGQVNNLLEFCLVNELSKKISHLLCQLKIQNPSGVWQLFPISMRFKH